MSVESFSQSDSFRGPPLVVCKWWDAYYDYEVAASDIVDIQPVLVETFGLLVYEDKRIVRIAGEIIHKPGEEDTYRAVTSIPACLVESLKPTAPA